MGTVTLTTVAAIAAGAAVGAPLRYLVDRMVTDRVTRSAADGAGASGVALFPWGLLVVNVLGSLLAGVVIASTAGDLRMLLLVGFCGAFTTFSGFAWETDRLWPDARPAFWLAVVTFPVACVAAFMIAWRLTVVVVA